VGGLELHGHDRGRRRALPKRGQNLGELALGHGTPEGSGFGPPFFDFTGHAWGTRAGDSGGELSYMAGVGFPPLVGYPPADGGGPATQDYVSAGIDNSALVIPSPYGFPAPAEESLAQIKSGQAILNGQLGIAVAVNVLNDTFKGTAPDHRLIAEVDLAGHVFDFYADEYDTWVGGFSGGLWRKTVLADPAASQALWDGLRDGISWPFTVRLYYWSQWSSGSHGPSTAVATPHWETNQTTGTRLQNDLQLLWPVREQTAAGPTKVASTAVTFDGHDRGQVAMPQTA
jgi:hypothetical protein